MTRVTRVTVANRDCAVVSSISSARRPLVTVAPVRGSRVLSIALQGLPQPSAQGALAKTPLPQLLVYVLERQLHGTLQLRSPSGEVATIFVVRGFPAKVRTTEGVARLGELLALEGLLGEEGLARAQERFDALAVAGTPKLAGQLYLEMGLLDEATLRIGLGRQIAQKIEHLFNWVPETTFAYFDGTDLLADYGPAPVTMIDPLPLVWSSVRDFPSWDHVNVALTRLGSNAVKLSDRAVVDRLELSTAQNDLVADLRARPMRLADLTSNPHVTSSVGQLLLYCLLITKQLQVVPVAEDEAPPAAPSSNMMPVSSGAGSGSSLPGAMAGMTPIPSTLSSPGTQVARVQLAKSKSSTGLPRAAVEEHAPIVRIDGRIATPMPGKYGSASSESEPLVPAYTARVSVASSPPGPMTASPTPNTPPPVPHAPHVPRPPLIPPAPPSGLAGLSGMTPIPSSIRSFPPPPPAPSPRSAASSFPAPPPPASTPSARPSIPPSSPSSGRVSIPPSSTRPVPPSSGASGSKPALTPEQTAVRQRVVAKAASIGSSNYFEILGVHQMATQDEIQTAFVSLAKIWHPDRLPAILGDVRGECSKVFSHIGEAHSTLIDPKRRAEYMHLLREGGATPDDQEKMAVLLGAATDFQKAEHFLKRGDHKKAEELVKKALAADPAQPEYLAGLAWLESMKPENQDEDSTMKRIGMLTEALARNPKFEKAVFYRAMLYKRLGRDRDAMTDFKLSVELNPRNIDSAREIRLYNMRRESKAPGGRNSTRPPGAAQIFGKLFKK